jgi:hypothetical protein
MDHKLYMATLRQHGAYLGQLVTELNTALQTLEQMLDEGTSPTSPEATVLVQEFGRLERGLSLQEEMLWKRLHIVLEDSRLCTSEPRKA